MRGDIIAVLDIGSYKIACLIAKKGANNKLHIIGQASVMSAGIDKSVITDIDSAKAAILKVVDSAEKSCKETIGNIDSLFVNISGQNLHRKYKVIERSVKHHNVSNRDIEKLKSLGLSAFSDNNIFPIHALILGYGLDDLEGIKNPLKMQGENLKAYIHAIGVDEVLTKNIGLCFAECHLNIVDYISSGYASALACLGDNKKKLSVLCLDIGSGLTDIAIFADEVPLYIDSVPFAGDSITNDIANYFSLDYDEAERVKTLYGKAQDSENDIDRYIENINGKIGKQINKKDLNVAISPEDNSAIMQQELNKVINARVEDILHMVDRKIKSMEMATNTCRIIITGGSAMLAGIDEIASKLFGIRAIVAEPTVSGNFRYNNTHMFSTAMGMLRYANSYNISYSDYTSIRNKKSSWLKRIVDRFKKN